MATDNQDLVLDATDPLDRAQGALRIFMQYAKEADHVEKDPLSLADGRYNRLAAAQRVYSEHAKMCALVALAGDVRRIADQLAAGEVEHTLLSPCDREYCPVHSEGGR